MLKVGKEAAPLEKPTGGDEQQQEKVQRRRQVQVQIQEIE
jgi:hypothetical protein